MTPLVSAVIETSLGVPAVAAPETETANVCVIALALVVAVCATAGEDHSSRCATTEYVYAVEDDSSVSVQVVSATLLQTATEVGAVRVTV